MLCVRAFFSTDHKDQIDLRIGRQHPRRILIFLCRVADRIRALYVTSTALDRLDNVLEFLGVQRRLINDLQSLVLVPVDRLGSFNRGHDVVKRRIEIVRIADDLTMLRIADEHEMKSLLERLL